jgi:hypothetical protein
MIAADVVSAIESGRCPLLLTGRTEHLQYFSAKLAGVAKHVFVLKGGMGGVALILDIDLKLREQPSVADEVSIL